MIKNHRLLRVKEEEEEEDVRWYKVKGLKNLQLLMGGEGSGKWVRLVGLIQLVRLTRLEVVPLKRLQR